MTGRRAKRRAERRMDGGLAARRAVVRWAWRLFRREWRQQILVLTLVTVSVGTVVAGASAAYSSAPSAGAEFGTASHILTIDGSDPAALQVELDSIDEWFGTTDVIPQWSASVPGSIEDFDMRGQDPDGPYGASMLSLRDGRYPTAPGEVALTDQVAATFQAGLGGRVNLDGRDWTVVGLVENPKKLNDEFALVSPDYAEPPDEVEILVETTEERIRSRPESGGAEGFVNERGTTEKGTAALVTYMVATVVLLLVALVAAAGFVVMAQRRQRQIGLLAATGATYRHLRLVMLANGMAVGAFAAVVGAAAGLLVWFAAAPFLEDAAGQRIGRFDVPWWVVAPGMLLAVATATAASWWPARLVARLSVTQALSARPPAPKPAHRSALLAAVVVGLGVAAIVWSNPDREATRVEPVRDIVTQVGIVAIAIGILFVCPLAVRALARLAGRFPVAARLALRDLARYQARSGAALGAVSLAVGIPVAVIITAAAANEDDVGNLSERQLMVRAGSPDAGPFVIDHTSAEVGELDSQAERIADTLRANHPIALDKPIDPGVEPEPGFEGIEAVGLGYPIDENTSRDVVTYVATPELLTYYGIDPDSVDPDLDVLTTRTEELTFHTTATRRAPEMVTERRRLDVTDYSSAPTSLFTSDAVRRRGWDTLRAGWLIVSDVPFTADQVAEAREIAAGARLTVEARRDYSNGSVRGVAVAAGTLVALAVVAMTVGLIRSEAAGDIRMLTATGATRTVRRRLTAWTAGALGFLGVLLGALGAYVALLSGYVRDLGTLSDVPLVELGAMAVGIPLLAAGAGWLLGGREPSSLIRPAS